MAEFVEVMTRKREMCELYSSCEDCPVYMLKQKKRENSCECLIEEYSQEAEKIIMAWEKPIDWDEVEVDTPILVSDHKNGWDHRHFAEYRYGRVFAWDMGGTSWTTSDMRSWKYAKLAERGRE